MGLTIDINKVCSVAHWVFLCCRAWLTIIAPDRSWVSLYFLSAAIPKIGSRTASFMYRVAAIPTGINAAIASLVFVIEESPAPKLLASKPSIELKALVVSASKVVVACKASQASAQV